MKRKLEAMMSTSSSSSSERSHIIEITKWTTETMEKKLEAMMSTSSSSEEGSHSILKLKKEAVAADGLWKEMMRRDVPGGGGGGGGMERWLKAMDAAAMAEETQPTKKRKKLVKTSLTPRFIEFLRNRPTRTFPEISAEKLSRKSETFRQEYFARKYIDGKWADYQNALVKQYDLLGHAEDEDEFTDDEDDDVVKIGTLAI